MTVRLLQPYLPVPDLEGDQDESARREDTAELREAGGQFPSGMCTVEYQESAPPIEASGRSSAVIDPTSKRRPGYVSRATAIIPGDRSTPNTSAPSSRRCDATRPVPHPRSATVRGPSRVFTCSTKAASIARSSGVDANWAPSRRS